MPHAAMSKHDFSAAEFADRLARARTAIGAAGLDWFVALHPVTMRWLTGSDAKSYQEFQCVLLSAAPGPVVVLTREGERNEFIDDALFDRLETHGGPEPEDPLEKFAAIARDLGLAGKRIGMEVPAYYLHPHDYLKLKDILGNVVEANTLLHDLTLVKSPAEIAYIRESSRIGDVAMQRFAAGLKEGRTELELAGDVYASLFASGSSMAASPINIVSGERSSYSHGAPTLRKLKRGDFGSVEYGSAYKRYTSTIGRQFSIGKPTARMVELTDLVRRAGDAQIAAIRDGVLAVTAHEAAKKVIAAAGLDHGRVHTSGYGLAPGFPPTWGEPMHMFGGSTYTLRAGMVVTIEPPVFLGEEKLGARLIDNVLVTMTGAELLSRYSRDLIVVD
jgi:Xaa-Pro dipeptidase